MERLPRKADASPSHPSSATAPPSDAALVAAARTGDRDAFATIVARHQGLVCAIAYAGAGDRARGDELAQEAFLEAWRGLAGLREPERLRAWLGGIARNVVRNLRRRDAREPAHVDTALDAADAQPSPHPTPEGYAIDAQERAIVTRALQQLPEAYREVLILYHWSARSVAEVAVALDLGEDAVRQRLARGRRLLRAEVEAVLERGLATSRPSRTFTVAVVAALPAGMPGSTSAAAIASAGFSGGALATGMAGAIGGSLAGLLGGVIGATASIRNTRSARERAFMVRTTWHFMALAMGFAAVLAAMALCAPAIFGSPWWYVPVVTVYGVVLVVAILRTNRRQRQIQIEDGTFVDTGIPSPRERRFVRVGTAIAIAYVAAFFAALLWVRRSVPAAADSAYWQLAIWSLYLVGLLQLIHWFNGRQHALRVAEGRVEAVAPLPVNAEKARAAIYGSHAGMFGAVLWVFPLCAIAGDWTTALVVLAAALTSYALSVRATLRRPERYFRIAAYETLAMGVLMLAVTTLRWDTWMIAYRTSSLYQASADLPLWAMNVLLIAVVAAVTVLLVRKDRLREPDRTA